MVPHLPVLRRYARRLARGDAARAEDLVQDTVVRALAKQYLFRPETDLGAWLRTLMHNENANAMRRAVRRREDLAAPDAHVFEHAHAVADTEARAHLREVARHLATLPRTQQRGAEQQALLGADDRAYAALARYEGVPVGTVRSRLSRARAALRVLARGVALSPEELDLL